MKKPVKIAVGAIIIIAIAVFAVISSMTPMQVGIDTVSAQDARITFTEQGIYAYEKTYIIYPIISGEILEVPISKGDTVKKGDVLTVMSASDFEYQIIKLESGIKSYQAQIEGLSEQEQMEKENLRGQKESLSGQIASIEAQISGQKKSGISLERQISYQEDVISYNRQLVRDARDQLKLAREIDHDEAIASAKFVLSQAEQAYASSQVYLEQLEDGKIPEGYYEGQLQSLQSQIGAIDSRLGKSYISAMTKYYNSLVEEAQTGIEEMREKGGKATVIAPVDGVITETGASDSNVIAQQTPICMIGTSECVEVYVATRELSSIKTGDRVELKLFKRSGDEIHGGTITYVDTVAEPRLSALGVEESKVRVLIRPDKKNLVIGEHIDVVFTVYEQHQALVVPKTAIFTADGQDMLWIVSDDAAYRKTVEKGMETRSGFIINSGLEENSQVIIDANIQGLAEGKKVSAVKKNS